MDRTDLKGILQRTAFTVALAVALPGLAWAQSETPNHFTCYEIKPFGFTAIPNVSLVDQFGSTVVTVGRPNKLCAPADKNGEDPTAPTAPDHLTAYQMRNPSIIKVRDQTVTNQFGTFKVDLIKTDWLFVPTAKSLVAPPPAAPLDPAVDHFQCYKARRSKGTPQFQKILDVNVEDQFGTGSIDLLRPSHLCAPVNKRGEEPGAETHPSHLLCYKLRARAPFKERHVWLGNQLGPLDDVLLTRRQQFCVPSLKNPITTSSTTTTPATTSSTTTTLAMCPYFGPPITDPSSLPECAPASLVPPGQQSLFASCDSGAGICAPDPIITTADNFVPSSCTSIGGVEGRCLSTCLPFVQAQANVLPTDVCASDERCVPCYDPTASDPTAPTGACSFGCDMPLNPPITN